MGISQTKYQIIIRVTEILVAWKITFTRLIKIIITVIWSFWGNPILYEHRGRIFVTNPHEGCPELGAPFCYKKDYNTLGAGLYWGLLLWATTVPHSYSSHREVHQAKPEEHEQATLEPSSCWLVIGNERMENRLAAIYLVLIITDFTGTADQIRSRIPC